MYFDKNYEQYIKSVLGEEKNTINNSNNKNTYNNDNINSYNSNEKHELEKFYPEIYKIIYPMITKRCSEITEPLTKDLLEDIADEIYFAIEGTNNEINLNINIDNKVIAGEGKNTNNNLKREEESIKEPIRETRGEYRYKRNNGLRDLIKILLIRELIGRPSRPGNIPPPPRPPYFPGRPPMPGPRPPIRPRGNENNIYEK